MRFSVASLAPAVALMGLAVGAVSGQDKEQSFQGKTTTEWIQQLKTSAGKERLQAIQALSTMMSTAGTPLPPTKAAPAVPHLAAALKDPDPMVRQFAVGTLGQIGPLAKEAVPQIAELLKDKDMYQQRNAALVLGKIGPDAASAAPALVQGLKTSDDITGRIICDALGKVRAKDAVPALLERVKGRQKGIWTRAAVALWQIENHPDAMAAVVGALTSNDVLERVQAIQAVGDIGPAAKTAVPALLENLKNDRYRAPTIKALKAVDPEAAKAAGIE